MGHFPCVVVKITLILLQCVISYAYDLYNIYASYNIISNSVCLVIWGVSLI